jgi:protein TonB
MNLMREKIRSWRPSPAEQESQKKGDKDLFEKAILGSLCFHIIIFYLILPKSPPPIYPVGRNPFINIRKYTPPKHQLPKKTAEKPLKKKILKPIPDPTPDEPEVYDVETFEPVFDPLSRDDFLVFGLPDRPPGPAGPIALSQVERPPETIFQVEPEFSDLARQARIEGKVVLRIVIDKKGQVTDIRVMKSMGRTGLDESAIEAVKKWKFKPAMRNKVPVDVWMDVTINFRLE